MGHTRIAVLLSLSLLSSPGAAAQTAAGGPGGVASPGPPRKVQEKEEKAFIRSVEQGDAAAVRLFLAAGVSANAGEDRAGGEAVLLRAIRGGHEEVVRLLLDAGAEVGARGNPDLVSALNLAVKVGRPRIVRALLDRRADVNYGDEDGHTNLMVAVWLTAISSLPAEAVGFVVPEDDDATRARLKVARGERLEILRMLLDAGAELNHMASDCGLSALMSATMYGDPEVVRALLDRGADPNVGTKDWNALRFATMTLEEVLEDLRKDADAGGATAEGERRKAVAFFEATAGGRAAAARLLREAGARELRDWPE